MLVESPVCMEEEEEEEEESDHDDGRAVSPLSPHRVAAAFEFLPFKSSFLFCVDDVVVAAVVVIVVAAADDVVGGLLLVRSLSPPKRVSSSSHHPPHDKGYNERVAAATTAEMAAPSLILRD